MKWFKGMFPMLLILVQLAGFNQNRVMNYDIPHPIYKENNITVNEESNWQGMIVPHHLVPFDSIMASYEAASSFEVKHVLLLSPDHFTISNREGITSYLDWFGYFGWMKTNKTLTERFSSLPYIYNDSTEVEVEHGLNSHIPLIKKYFPNADITVIALANTVIKSQIDEMIGLIPEDVFIIGSVDFSHYYPREEADVFDAMTEERLLAGKYSEFWGLSDAYFDSPGVLYLLTTWAEWNDYRLNIENQCNSADYMGYNLNETTSYFFISFTKENK